MRQPVGNSPLLPAGVTPMNSTPFDWQAVYLAALQQQIAQQKAKRIDLPKAA